MEVPVTEQDVMRVGAIIRNIRLGDNEIDLFIIAWPCCRQAAHAGKIPTGFPG